MISTPPPVGRRRSSSLRLLISAVVLGGCSQLETEENPPIYVTQNPVCAFFCLSTLGTIREQTTGSGGGAVTGGASSLSQTQSATPTVAAGVTR